jgi:transposase InsO family protein
MLKRSGGPGVQTERPDQRTKSPATRAEARAAIFEYIEVFDNGKCRHSSLGYFSPAAYEQAAE